MDTITVDTIKKMRPYFFLLLFCLLFTNCDNTADNTNLPSQVGANRDGKAPFMS